MATKTASLEERLQANPGSLVFSRLAEDYRTSGDIARAIDLCVSGNEKHPEYVTGRIVIGRCYTDLENFESAAEAFSSVCRLDRHNMVAMKMLADSFMRLGAREKAGDLYAQLAAIDPWNKTLSQMAVRTCGTDAAAQPEIPVSALMEKAPELPAAPPKAAREKEPPAAVDTSAKTEVMQEIPLPEPAIMELMQVEKADAVREISEISASDETFSEATTVTGNDITDRMAMLFGEGDSVGKQAMEVAPPAEQEIAETLTEDIIEIAEVQPIDSIPDGNTISSRIDELFSRETLKMPAIRDAAGKKDEKRQGEAGDIAPTDESEFEETMIMDAAEVKDFLREDTIVTEPLQKTTAGDELISDDSGDAVVMNKNDAELVVDEKDSDGAGSRSRPDDAASGEFTPAGDTVTGDDVVRQMTDLFEEEDDKAIAEVVGSETVDDFFAEAVTAAIPAVLEGQSPAGSPPSSATVEPQPATSEDGEMEATVVEGDMISGDDVAGRIEGMFRGAEKEQVAKPSDEKDGKGGIEDTRVVDAGVLPSETGAIEDTVVESANIISGNDIKERLDEYFPETTRPAGKKGALISDEETVTRDLPQPEADKKAETEETVIAGDIDAVDLASETIDCKETAFHSGADEEVLVEAVEPSGEALDALEPAGSSETRVSGSEDDKEATAVFTDFRPVSNAPPPPPEVPLFTTQTPRSLDEETIIAETSDAAAGAEPVEPDIPDHVLTPTLADIYLEQGQPLLALKIYRRLKEKNPHNEKLDARIKEIEKAQAEGIVAARPATQTQKSAALKSRKKAAGHTTGSRQKKGKDDSRPLAGVRLKKRPGTTWRKK